MADPERNARIIELAKAGKTPADITELLFGAEERTRKRHIVIGVLNRAGIKGGGQTMASKRRVGRQAVHRAKQAGNLPFTSRLAKPPSAAPAQGESKTLLNQRKWVRQGKGGHVEKVPITYDLKGAMRDARPDPGKRFAENNGCSWPLDDRSPWPRNPLLNIDYLYCGEKRHEVVKGGERKVLPYCWCHWKRSHATNGPGAISIPKGV